MTLELLVVIIELEERRYNMFSYKPLMRLLLEKDMSKTQFRDFVDISPSTLAKISKNKNISMDILNNICCKLDCKIEDIIEYVPDEPYVEADQ